MPFYDGMLVGQDIPPFDEVDVCEFTGFRIDVGHQFDKGIAEKFRFDNPFDDFIELCALYFLSVLYVFDVFSFFVYPGQHIPVA